MAHVRRRGLEKGSGPLFPIVAALAALFAFRLAFGLSSEFFFEDETQVFLIGLKHYATGNWPFFGADVVWTRSEIPGALQGLLVSLPLRIERAAREIADIGRAAKKDSPAMMVPMS